MSYKHDKRAKELRRQREYVKVSAEKQRRLAAKARKEALLKGKGH